MHLGRYEAIAEIVLAKITLETGDITSFWRWIEQAENLAERAGNKIDKSTCYILYAFYFQRGNEPQKVIEYLVKARGIYLGMKDYDKKTRDTYIQKKFPKIWDNVFKHSSLPRSTRPSGI